MSDSLQPMDCSMPGLSAPHHLPKFAQVHIHFISGAIQPFHPLTASAPSALNLSQNQGLFQWISCSHSNLIVLWPERCLIWFNLNLPRLALWLSMWSILANVPCALKRMCILLLLNRTLSLSVCLSVCLSLEIQTDTHIEIWWYIYTHTHTHPPTHTYTHMYQLSPAGLIYHLRLCLGLLVGKVMPRGLSRCGCGFRKSLDIRSADWRGYIPTLLVAWPEASQHCCL